MPSPADAAVYETLKRRRFLPINVFVQISRRCNLSCSMCGWHVWKRNTGIMSDKIFGRVLEEMAANKIGRLAFSGAQGEPLLAPNMSEFLDAALQAKLRVEINTNCTPLGERNIAMLAKAATTGRFVLQASFSGYDKPSYEAIYVGAKFEDSSRKIKKLFDAFEAVGKLSSLAIRGCIIDDTRPEKHADYLRSIGLDLSKLKYAAFLPNDNFAGLTKSAHMQKPVHFCSILAGSLIVYDDGKVSACACRDSENVMEIGDITNEGFLDMRNGPRFAGMMQAFLKRDISGLALCSKCDLAH